MSPHKRRLRLEPSVDRWTRYPSRNADFTGLFATNPRRDGGNASESSLRTHCLLRSISAFRRIVREHGGEIEIESNEGKGVRVTIHLPYGDKRVRMLQDHGDD